MQRSTPDELEHYTKLAYKTKFSNMNTFLITYDRHKGMYGERYSDFPDSYDCYQSSLDYKNDPDWTVKMRLKRLELKKWIFIFFLIVFLFKWREKRVEEFDRRKRREQRAM
jgi:hypothetical protein